MTIKGTRQTNNLRAAVVATPLLVNGQERALGGLFLRRLGEVGKRKPRNADTQPGYDWYWRLAGRANPRQYSRNEQREARFQQEDEDRQDDALEPMERSDHQKHR